MRKFTSIASLLLAAVLTVTAGAAPAGAQKATRNQASKAPAAVTFDKSSAKKVDSRVMVQSKRQAAGLSHSMFGKAVRTPLSKTSLMPRQGFKLNAAANCDLNSAVIYNANDAGFEVGIYTIPGLDPVMVPNGNVSAGTVVGDHYVVTNLITYGSYIMGCETYVYDVNTWEQVSYNPEADYDAMAFALATDPLTGTIYGMFYNENFDGYEFGTLDPVTVQRTGTISTPLTASFALGFNAAGELFAMNRDGALVKLNKSTGEETVVANTGLATRYITSGTTDVRGNTFYYATCTDEEMEVYAIDLGSYSVSKLTNGFGCELAGMFVKAPAADDGAPEAAEILSVNFPDGALAGTVEFKAPTTKFDGSALTGSLSYRVLANGEQVATGTVEAGATVTANVTVAAAGDYTISVICTNSVGDGPAAAQSLWIGPDAPAAPANVVLLDNGNTLNLTWDAVTTSAHGGYFNAAEVTYNVNRLLGGVYDATVATGLTATSFSETIAVDNLKVVSYEVVAVFQGTKGAAGTSNAVVLGAIVPPYTQEFATEDALEGFTIIDANNDGKAWTWTDSGMRMMYNANLDMDDYLILPPVELEAGKSYEITIGTKNQGRYPERVEVLLGTAPTVAAMNAGVTVVPATDVTWNDPMDLSGTITPASAGKYYVAIHGISDPDELYLYVTSVAISAPFEGITPDVVTDVVFKGQYDGSSAADISFKAPTTRINGEAVGTLTKIEVSRDGELVKTFDNPAAGAELSFKDVVAKAGDYAYSFVAYNENGAGKAYNTTQYVGLKLAAGPVDIELHESYAVPGYVYISWTPVAEDIDGNAIDPSLITYTILDANQDIIGENIPASEPEFGYQAVPEGQQDFVYFFVIATDAAGYNTTNYGVTDMIAAGTPLEMPFQMTLADGAVDANVMIEVTEDSSSLANKWDISSSCSDPEATPYDNDGGMLSWWPMQDDCSTIWTGKIHVDPVETVGFSFYYHTTGNSAAYQIQPVVKVMGYEYDLGDAITTEVKDGEEGWIHVLLPLVDYIESDVQLGIRATCYDMTPYLLIDNIEARAFCAQDLGVAKFNAPKSIEVGSEGVLTAVITNYGLADATAYTVELLRDGEVEESVELQGLAVGESETVVFTQTPDLFWHNSYIYQVRINYAADENEANNESINLVVNIAESMLPIVEDLNAELTEEGVALSWTAPDTASRVEEYVEDVESYESYAIDQAGDWTFIDVDSAPTYGFTGISFPNANEPMAFMVFDATVDPVNLEGITFSGDKVFACFAAVPSEGGPNDDWMISPELPGIAQTLSFMARSWTADYGEEQFEVYYSTTSPAIADMIQLGDRTSVGEEWTEETFELPEGTKYFAIRCVSNDAFIFLVDDIKFMKGTAELTVASYDIYRNGEKIANTTSTSYVDNTVEADNDYTYFVVVNYTTGMSGLSNPAEVSTSGIDNINLGQVKVYVEGNTIVVAGADGKLVNIYAPNGATLYNALGKQTTRVVVEPGVYVVKAGNKVAKVNVK